MRKVIKFICILSFLLTVYGCNRQSVKKPDLISPQLPNEKTGNDDIINENTKCSFDKIHIELDKIGTVLIYDIRIGDSTTVVKDKLEKSHEKFTIGKDPHGIIQIWNNVTGVNDETFILYFYDDALFHVNRWKVSIDEIHKLKQFNEKFNFEQLKKYEEVIFYCQNVQYRFMKDSSGFTISIDDLGKEEEISKVYDE